MSLVKGATNYDGGYSDLLYKSKIGVGNEVVEKGAAYMYSNISEKKELGRISGTANPIRAWASTPASTQTVTRSKRDLTMADTMIYMVFQPNDWSGFWEKWQSVGVYTDLQLNPELLGDILELTASNAGTQSSALFWQGDTGGAVGVNEFDGIVTLALADAEVTDVVTSGAITKANVIDIIEDVWTAIPQRVRRDPNAAINMSYTDFDFLQQANLDAMKTTTGVLRTEQGFSFLGTPIRAFEGLTAGSIVAAASGNYEQSNLIYGTYFDAATEYQNVRIGRVENNSELWFLRVNMKMAAQYRDGKDIVLYQPV